MMAMQTIDMGHVTGKTIFGFCDQEMINRASEATVTGQNLKYLLLTCTIYMAILLYSMRTKNDSSKQ